MVSEPANTVFLSFSPLFLAVADPNFNPAQRLLSTIDRAVFGLAAVLVVAGSAWWVLAPRKDLLRGSPPRPNRLREDSLALAVLVYLVAAIAMAGVARALIGNADSLVARVAAGSGAQIAGIAICLIIAAERFDGGARRFCLGSGTLRPGTIVSVTVVGVILATALCPVVLEATVQILHRVVPAYQVPPHPTITALHGEANSPSVRLAMWLGAAMVAPIAEEFFFRGLLQTLLVNVLKSRWKAIVVASAAFAAVHVVSQPQAIPALIVLALLIGYVYERTGSLVGPMLIHAVFNLKTLVWDALGAFP